VILLEQEIKVEIAKMAIKDNTIALMITGFLRLKIKSKYSRGKIQIIRGIGIK
jgi:hypothetical protein